MSYVKKSSDKVTIPRLVRMHKNGEKISMLTAYDFTMAGLVDEAGIDMILVGDSLGMVVQGHPNTLPVNIEDMIYHTQCVSRAVSRAHIMADMPFLSYQISHDDAVRNAGELIKVGAESVKIEGGEEMGDLVWYMNKIGIPVMAHIGLKPQSIHTMGGYKIQGKLSTEAEQIIMDAEVLEEAGAFALLLEGIPLEVAQKISETVSIPTIGIGSGPHCSGQVLVVNDVLGLNPDFKPKFVKKYADVYEISQRAFQEYIKEVKSGAFPSEDHCVKRDLKLVGVNEESEKSTGRKTNASPLKSVPSKNNSKSKGDVDP